MKFKINWGWGIVIFFLIFFGSIIFRVIITSNEKINLVTPDYYPKGITYDQEIKKRDNYNNLKDKLKVSQDAENVIVRFPRTNEMGGIEGVILVYRPADFEDDSTFIVALHDSLSIFTIPKNFMKKGLYQIKADWVEDSIPFYAQKSIFINK